MRNYNGNRAPVGVYLHAARLVGSQEVADQYSAFFRFALSLPDVWVVTVSEVSHWVEQGQLRARQHQTPVQQQTANVGVAGRGRQPPPCRAVHRMFGAMVPCKDLRGLAMQAALTLAPQPYPLLPSGAALDELTCASGSLQPVLPHTHRHEVPRRSLLPTPDKWMRSGPVGEKGESTTAPTQRCDRLYVRTRGGNCMHGTPSGPGSRVVPCS